MAAGDRAGEWEAAGSRIDVAGESIFVSDRQAVGAAVAPPLLIVHGFPTSSIDFSECIEALTVGRRVVMMDLAGFGLSDKPDRHYSLFEQADLVEAVAAWAGLTEVDLLTHDMGDSVGGELLARALENTLSFAVRRRVLANGSIYLDMANLTEGQHMLWSLPDEKLPAEMAMGPAGIAAALVDILGSRTRGRPEVADHVAAAAELVVRNGGDLLMPRLIRYLDERKAHEERFTGAIERHVAPLAVVWGDDDPIAVTPMASRVVERRNALGFADATHLDVLDGVGHFPMIEAPDDFSAAVVAALD